MKEFSYVIEDIQEIFPAIYEVLSEQKAMQARRSFVAVYGRRRFSAATRPAATAYSPSRFPGPTSTYP